MGIIYNNSVEESEIYQAYGLTVYGKVNRFKWTMCNEVENALITIRISDSNKDIFAMPMGNRYIFQCRIDDTMDNFLWWITNDNPDAYCIERQIYKSLCASDSLFNHKIRQRKEKQKKEKEEKMRVVEVEKTRQENKNRITAYCDRKGLIPFIDAEDVYLVKTHNEKAYNTLKTCNMDNMRKYIAFMKDHPDNTDACIVKGGTIEEILKYIA